MTARSRPASARESHFVAGDSCGVLVDVTGAADRLGCSERFMRRLVQERRIPFIKLGGTKVRFLVGDLDRWVVNQRVEQVR